MATQLDGVLAQMAELTAIVKGRDKGELQWADVEKAFGAQIDALVAAQVKAQMDAQPAFRGGAQPIGHDGAVKAGRYNRFLKSFGQNQQHVSAGQSFQPIDLLIAKTILDGQVLHYAPAMGGAKAQPASDDLNAAIKALTSTGSGTGDELVPTGMASQLWNDFFLPRAWCLPCSASTCPPTRSTCRWAWAV